MNLLLKLLLAHLAGDFLLQPDGWVRLKETRKLRAYPLYLHVLIHFALIMLLVWDLEFWKWALLLSASHLLMDIIKIFSQRDKTKRAWFFADQAVHLVLVILVWAWYMGGDISISFFSMEYFLLLITAVYFLTQPGSAIIRAFISRWSPDSPDHSMLSLENAGKYIGILERLLVFLFVMIDHWEAIGFLLAAKSVFRFGDLRESKDRKLTEYVLIGTLLSFGIAMLTGIVYLKAVDSFY